MEALLRMAGLWSEQLYWIALGMTGAYTIYLCIQFIRQTSRPKKFPPGPRPVPLLGNLHQIPKEKQFIKYGEWAKEYGPIVGLKLGTRNCIVLNRWRDVRELLEKRGSIYNSRPQSTLGDMIFPGQVNLIFILYGPVLQMVRKAIASLLSVTKIDSLLPLQEAEAAQSAVELVETPERYHEIIQRYSTGIILSSVYGIRGASFNSPDVQEIHSVQDRLTTLIQPGTTFPPIEVFPWVRFLPEFLAPWKREARAVRNAQQNLYRRLRNKTMERIANGTSPECFIQALERDQHKYDGMNESRIVHIGGMMMEAGSDTTTSMLLSTLLLMVKHPEVLKKAQAEVDELCGTTRSPTLKDAPEMPYINAVVEEVLRFRPGAPAALLHATTQDDWYQGYFIPKDTTVIPNLWTINRDECEYDRPNEFLPERYLKNKFGVMDDSEKSGRKPNYTFGLGRRVCQGQRLAERSLMINVSKMVWAFDIRAPLDPRTGKPVHVDDDVVTAYTSGVLFHPNKFPISITPRSEKHVEILRHDLEKAKLVFQKYE